MTISDLAHTAEVRAALARHDVSTAYRLLIAGGVTQRELAQATGQSQSEVSDIRAGRKVFSVWVLERIADGLGVERGLMGLGWGAGEPVSYGGPAEEVSEAVKRRNFINAVAGAVVWGHPVIRDLLTAPDLAAASPLPAWLGAHDVTALRDVTEQMRLLARQYGGQADAIGGAAQRYDQLMTVGGTEQVKHALGSALAELHTVAGWACHDAMAPDAARYHFSKAVRLAQDADDAYQQADALYHCGAAFEEQGGPNEALKLLQMGQIRLHDAAGHPRVGVLGSWFYMDSARAYATMGYTEQAKRSLGKAREHWDPSDVFDKADFDHVTAMVYRDLGQLDTATTLAATSARIWTGEQRRESVLNDITLADLYLKAGERAGAQFAKRAIDGTAELSSARARDHLAPLVPALAASRADGARALAHEARRVASSRA